MRDEEVGALLAVAFVLTLIVIKVATFALAVYVAVHFVTKFW